MESIRENSFEEILIEYMPMIRGIVNTYPQNSREDLLQEGILGLNNALQAYDESLNVPFKQFARKCIKNRVNTAYRKYCRDDTMERIDEEQAFHGELLEDNVIRRKDTEAFFERLRTNLSELESKILTEYLSDKSYEMIAISLGVSVKTVDNTLTRIKNKIKKLYE